MSKDRVVEHVAPVQGLSAEKGALISWNGKQWTVEVRDTPDCLLLPRDLKNMIRALTIGFRLYNRRRSLNTVLASKGSSNDAGKQ